MVSVKTDQLANDERYDKRIVFETTTIGKLRNAAICVLGLDLNREQRSTRCSRQVSPVKG